MDLASTSNETWESYTYWRDLPNEARSFNDLTNDIVWVDLVSLIDRVNIFLTSSEWITEMQDNSLSEEFVYAYSTNTYNNLFNDASTQEFIAWRTGIWIAEWAIGTDKTRKA